MENNYCSWCGAENEVWECTEVPMGNGVKRMTFSMDCSQCGTQQRTSMVVGRREKPTNEIHYTQ